MAPIVLEGVTKVYPDDTTAVRDIDLTVGSGEFMVLVGPSGCGKSTLLRMIAGLEETTEGRILIGDRDVTNAAPRDRDVAMVFQNYALYPHMSVRDNLGFSLKVTGTPKAELRERVDAVAKMLGLTDYLDRKPGQLSGGQRQRVAMGRAIVREPTAYLMDEPLSNLDAKLRVSMRAELTNLHKRLEVTTVYVTHDQVEAKTLGQRVAVIDDGRVQQVAHPQELYRRPANVFVATFIGSPSMNVAQAKVGEDTLSFGQFTLPIPEKLRPVMGNRDTVIAGLRPEAFGTRTDGVQVQVDAAAVENLGDESHVFFGVDAPPVSVATHQALEETPAIVEDTSTVFIARLGPDVDVQPGSTVSLSVDADRLYLFDAETGETLLT
ncbi:MAG TPA: sn-glycerol-3-phosphate ABC transporter ATP-binding protein UgpC [Actinomycetes bacterium]|nr:sn-glycerol-3-phosphate ABC transporter ATP-binding protein UgpC [Actinomycetes bacterium]